MLDLTKIFDSDQLLLRPICLDDYDHFKKMTNDGHLWTYFTCDLSDEKSLKQWVEASVNDKTRMAYTIIDKNSKALIGSSSLGNYSPRDKRIEIGWTWLGREFQGKGYNDKVKNIFLKYCFEELFVERVEFKTDVLNMPARKALLRIGAVEEGVLRSHTLMTQDRRRNTIYYSILKNEWIALKQ